MRHSVLVISVLITVLLTLTGCNQNEEPVKKDVPYEDIVRDFRWNIRGHEYIKRIDDNILATVILSDRFFNQDLDRQYKEMREIYKVYQQSTLTLRGDEDAGRLEFQKEGDSSARYYISDSTFDLLEYDRHIDIASIEDGRTDLNDLGPLESNLDKQVYDYMMKEFEEYGIFYDPEFHDERVLEKASQRFDLPVEIIDEMFIRYAMSLY
ncbi:hypothetical protein RB298_04985 [Priestia sp. BR_2]